LGVERFDLVRSLRGAAALTAIALAVCLSGCGRPRQAAGGKPPTPLQQSASAVNAAEPGGWDTRTPGGKAPPYDPAIVKLQVLLDRVRFSPGVIDGHANDNVRRAVLAYEQANGIQGDGTLNKAVWKHLTMADPRPAVRAYVIDADVVAGPFTPEIPRDFPTMARLEQLDYRSPAEELAEAFHMDVSLLQALNPGASFRPGTTVLVADRGGDDLGTDIGRLEVDRGQGLVRANAADGRLLAVYPASIGSRTCPALTGTLEIRSIAAQPTYSYDSDSVGVAGATRGRTEIAAGPNNPLGVVWINLSKDGYGIHGAPAAAEVGKAGAHGCVRLTNWDARELARGVSPGVKVVFK
jgi:lipoprotein-anchoring transpeptidase ErfK/SrfK